MQRQFVTFGICIVFFCFLFFCQNCKKSCRDVWIWTLCYPFNNMKKCPHCWLFNSLNASQSCASSQMTIPLQKHNQQQYENKLVSIKFYLSDIETQKMTNISWHQCLCRWAQLWYFKEQIRNKLIKIYPAVWFRSCRSRLSQIQVKVSKHCNTKKE